MIAEIIFNYAHVLVLIQYGFRARITMHADVYARTEIIGGGAA